MSVFHSVPGVLCEKMEHFIDAHTPVISRLLSLSSAGSPWYFR